MSITKDFKKSIAFVSLGCDKNRVDLEKMMAAISASGFFTLSENADDANVILINTCAFINIARKEAIDTILSFVNKKGNGTLEKIVVTGCLPQKNFNEVKESIPEIDALVKIKDNPNIVKTLLSLYDSETPKFKTCKFYERKQSTPAHYAFLKIADGCNNCCSYCTIPYIRGRYISSTIEDVIKEARELASNGVKELILVAQDVTRYGMDLYGEPKLCELIEKLTSIKEIDLIRLHYCYPELVTDQLLKVIDENPKVAKYIDIPLQHVSDKILKSMNRRSTNEQIKDLLEKIKALKNKIAIRSTFIIGYPGETRKDFKELCNFLIKYRLDNVGFFIYSKEEGTRACYLKNQVREFIKHGRLKVIEKLQNKIQNELNLAKIGQEIKIRIDKFDENSNKFIARDEFNSPDIDFCVILDADANVEIGKTYNFKLTNFEHYYFEGELV